MSKPTTMDYRCRRDDADNEYVARYELRTEAGEVLSKHHTKQGAFDRWRLHVGKHLFVWRRYSDGRDYLVVEGTWHMPMKSV